MTVVKLKKAKPTKTCVIKRKLKFENYRNCLKATQPDNKTNYLENNEINAESLTRDHKEFIENNKLKLKPQKRFKSKRYKLFTEEINKIA